MVEWSNSATTKLFPYNYDTHRVVHIACSRRVNSPDRTASSYLLPPRTRGYTLDTGSYLSTHLSTLETRRSILFLLAKREKNKAFHAPFVPSSVRRNFLEIFLPTFGKKEGRNKIDSVNTIRRIRRR